MTLFEVIATVIIFYAVIFCKHLEGSSAFQRGLASFCETLVSFRCIFLFPFIMNVVMFYFLTFSFWNNVKTYGKIAEIVQSSHIPFTQLLWMLTSYVTIVIIKTRNLTLAWRCFLNCRLYSDFPIFPAGAPLPSRYPTRGLTLHVAVTCLGRSQSVSVAQSWHF